MWGGGMMVMGVLWLVLVVAVLWLVVRAAGRRGFGANPESGPDRAETILRERYARGDIDQAAYRQMLEELRRGR